MMWPDDIERLWRSMLGTEEQCAAFFERLNLPREESIFYRSRLRLLTWFTALFLYWRLRSYGTPVTARELRQALLSRGVDDPNLANLKSVQRLLRTVKYCCLPGVTNSEQGFSFSLRKDVQIYGSYSDNDVIEFRWGRRYLGLFKVSRSFYHKAEALRLA